MAKLIRRHLLGHETLEVRTSRAYRPYDHLVLRAPKGRTVWTVLDCEPNGEAWTVTAIRCPKDCKAHHRKR